MRLETHALIACALILTALTLGAAPAAAQPTWTQSFAPSTIGPGSATVLTYRIDTADPVRDLAFSNMLPAGLVVATPSSATSGCGGSLTAVEGSSDVTFVGGLLGGGSSCTISVTVFASTAGVYANTTGDLTSSGGNSGTSSATLTVDATRPGFTKSFTPDTVGFGGRSTLTFTIDSPSDLFTVSFTDSLPSGMVVANPVNASTTCVGGTVTASPGATSISFLAQSFSPFVVTAGSSCTVSLGVEAQSVGTLDNLSGELTAQGFTGPAASGLATARLTARLERLALTKEFVADPVSPGDSVTLRFTIRNIERRASTTDIAFTDDLDAVLPGLIATGLPASPCGGTLTGSSVLSFSGGTLAPEASCSFDVTLSVPAGAANGGYTNVTSEITGVSEGSSLIGSAATDVLFVSAGPTLGKSFAPSVAGAGAAVSMDFTITNPSATSSATGITFSDDLDAFISGVGVVSVPPAGFCGSSSTAVVSSNTGSRVLQVVNAELAPGASCTFSVGLEVPTATPSGDRLNETSALTSTLDGETITTEAAQAVLTVVTGPQLFARVLDDPAAAGGTVRLELSLSLGEEATLGATDIAFTADLGAALAGLVATDTPQADTCGTGSLVDGTSVLTFSGGSLDPGASCVTTVTLQVPTGASPGSSTITTSEVTSDVSGTTVVSPSAFDTLRIAGLTFTKDFFDDPVIAGDTANLEFVIVNDSQLAASDISVSQPLTFINGLTVGSLPTEPCGIGSSAILAGTNVFIVGGNLAPGGSCAFSLPLIVPAGTESGDYPSQTSDLSARFDGAVTTFAPASDSLTVFNELLQLSKTFVDDPVSPGDTVVLRFTLVNVGDETVDAIAFTDDLDAVAAGMVSTSGMQTDVCGAGSTLDGSSLLSLTGGSLAAGASCTFEVTVVVPGDVAPGSELTNVTSSLTGDVRGLTVTGDPATATLRTTGLIFSKAFGGFGTTVPVEPGGQVALTFTIENPTSEPSASRLGFTDDLDAMMPGLVAVGSNLIGVCGPESEISTGSVINAVELRIAAGATCSFSLLLEVPLTAAPGDYLNTTSELTAQGLRQAAPATATLTVVEAGDACLGTVDARGCCVDDFSGTDLLDVWSLDDIGDAAGASATVAGGRLELSGTGSELYHGDDNGAFLHQTVAGDFRLEIDVVDVPVHPGATYAKGGLMVRDGLAPDAARVAVHYVPTFPAAGGGTSPALMFDARDALGNTYAFASTVPGVTLPVRLALQRRGDRWSVFYSTDGGQAWIQPAGGAGGEGAILMSAAVLAGPTVTSYDLAQPMTVAFDDASLCRPSGVVPIPATFACDPAADLDLVVVLDRSGTMERDHGGSGVSKHDAAVDAVIELLDALPLRSGDTRTALVTVEGTDDAAINLAAGATVESGFVAPSALADLLAGVSLPVADPIGMATSPFAIGFEEVLALLETDGDPARGAVVLFATDLIPNIDAFGEGPAAYREDEIASIGLTDGSGDFLPAGEVAWLGNFNPTLGVFDGQVLADSMVAIELLRDEQGDLRILSLVPRGTAAFPPVLPEGLGEYAAWYTQGEVFGGDDPAALLAQVDDVLTAIDCGTAGPAVLSGRVFDDLDEDGVFDDGEPGLGGVDVTATDSVGTTSTVTAADGTWTLSVVPGTVTVTIDASDLGASNQPTGDPDGVGTPHEATFNLAPWQQVSGAGFGYAAAGGGPLVGCLDDGFDDGSVDPAWTAAFLGNADQGGVSEAGGVLRVEGDGTTAYTGSDNGVFVYRAIQGDYRVEVDVAGFPKNEGGTYRKAGLMLRAGLGSFGPRVMVQLVPDFAGSGPVLQFRARTTTGGQGDVAIASNVALASGGPDGAPVRLAVEKAGNLYSVEYSIDGGTTWITPAGGSQGSITVDLGIEPLVGMNVVSYDANVTLAAELDDFEACAPASNGR